MLSCKILRGFEGARGVVSTDLETGRAHGVENIRGCADDELVGGYLVVFTFDFEVGEFVIVEKTTAEAVG